MQYPGLGRALLLPGGSAGARGAAGGCVGQGRLGLLRIHYPACPATHSWILTRSRCGQDLEDVTWLGNHRVQMGPYKSASNHGPPQGSQVLQNDAVFKAWVSASFLSNDPGQQRLFSAQDDNLRRTCACSQAIKAHESFWKSCLLTRASSRERY